MLLIFSKIPISIAYSRKGIADKGRNECHDNVDQPQPRKPPNFLEGVKLRRKKFSHLLPKPLNLRQRQSMQVTAHLHEYVKKSLPSR